MRPPLTDLAIHSVPVDLPLERVEAEITELSGHVAAAASRILVLSAGSDGQRPIGIAPSTIESRVTSARLDLHFVVSVLARHIARQRQRRRLRGDVTAETPTVRARQRANRAWVPPG